MTARRYSLPVVLALLAGGIASAVATGGVAQAASQTFTVTSTANSGGGSLRDAITSAQATSDEDTIVFDNTVFAPGSLHTITLSSVLPTITKPLNIVGPGQSTLAISGDDTTRILVIDQGNNTPPGIEVRISDLTLTRGKPASGNGGAMSIKRAKVTLTRVTVSRSQAPEGGGAYVDSASLTAIDSLFEDDTATTWGGAIRNDYGGMGEAYSYISLQGTTLQRNRSNGDGGAVYAARPLHMTNSTVTGNSAAEYGGGLWIGYGFHHTVTGSTITSNTALNGGGLSLGSDWYKGMTTIQNSTITGNVATSGVGGGLWLGSMIVKLIDDTISNGASGNCKPTWGVPSGSSLNYSNIVSFAGSSISDNTCSQLDRAVTITSFTGAVNGATSIIQASSDPPFLIGDRIRFCQPNGCNISNTKTGVVTSVSSADDTIAVTAEGTVSSWAGYSGMYGGAWVNLPKLWSVTPSSGAGGTSVTVSGTGFGTPSASPTVGLTFGGASATGITLVDDSTMTATTPAGSGSVAVGASSNANTASISSTTLSGAFSFPGGGPTITGVSPSSGPTGGGTPVVITGTNFTGTTSVTFGGAAAAFTEDSATQITATTAPGAAGPVDLVVTATSGSDTEIGAFTYVAPTPPPPVFPPSAPTGLTVSAIEGGAEVSWAAPADAGSYPVSLYRATAYPGSLQCLTSSLSCGITGLRPGMQYFISVSALSGAGWGTSAAGQSWTMPAITLQSGVRSPGPRRDRLTLQGSVVGIDPGTGLTVWLRMGRDGQPQPGQATVKVRADGTFEWTRSVRHGVPVWVSVTGDYARSRIMFMPA